MAFLMESDEEFGELLEQELEGSKWERFSDPSCDDEPAGLEGDRAMPGGGDILNLNSLLDDEVFESGGGDARGQTGGFRSLVDSSDSDDSVQNEPERIDWEAIQDDFSEFKDDLAVATGIGTMGTKKKQGKKKGTVGRRKRSGPRKVRPVVLSEATKAKIGRINFLYANQEHEEAISLCQKVIASDPSIADPWITLAQIYEDLGAKEKALNFFLVAAFIAKFDGFYWKQAGDVAKNLGKLDQAIFCYTQAINCDPKDSEALKLRLDASIHTQQPRTRILRLEPYDMNIIRKVMALAREYKLERKCQKILDFALDHYLKRPQDPVCFTFDDINLATELAIIEGDFMKGIRRIYRGYEILIAKKSNEWDEEGVALSDIVDGVAALQHTPHLPLPLKVKLGVLLILVHLPKQGKPFLNCLYEMAVEEYSDVYFEVISILAMNEDHLTALEVLNEFELRHPEPYTLDYLMAKATSHFKLGESEAAISLLKEAEGLDPNDLSPKAALSIIYEELGQDTLALDYFAKVRDLHYFDISKKRVQTITDKARSSLGVSRRPPPSKSARLDGVFNSDFRFHGGELETGESRLVLGKGHFKYSLLTDNSQTINKLLTRFSAVAFKQDLGSVELFFRLGFALYREFIRRRAETPKDLPPQASYALTLPPIEAQLNIPCPALHCMTLCKLPLFHWLAFFTHLSITLARHHRYIDAQQVLMTIEKNSCIRPYEQPRIYLPLLAMALADEAVDYCSQSEHLRHLFGEQNPCFHGDMFTLYMAVMAMGRSKKHVFGSSINFRFFSRAARRSKGAKPSRALYAASQYLLGHMVCSTRSFVKSLSYFFNAHREFPDDPAICLSLAIAYQHSAFQRNTSNRHIQVLQSFTYLMRYAKIKGFNQEVRYNFARTFHRLSLFNLAIPHYEAALALSDTSRRLRNQGFLDSPEIIPLDQDVSFEAAYNLSLIYHQIGSPGLADMYVQKYCVV